MAGSVVDPSGAAVPGAVVQLTGPGGEQQTVTDAVGRFLFEQVRPGRVVLAVTFANFAPERLAVTAPQRDLRIVLEPMPVEEAVTVRAPVLTASRTATATGFELPLRDVPQAVSIISSSLIADQTMGSLADLVRYVPGLGIAQGEGHRDAPIFRGFTSTADLFVNGIRDDTQYLRDFYNVERVEVLKGPNGLMFGRGGVGGVINRVTRQADWAPERELTLQAGSFGGRRLTADVGQALTDAMAARVTGLYENSGTYRDAVELERYGINPTVAFALGPKTRLRAGYELFHDERTTDRGIPSLDGRPLDLDRSTFFGSEDVNRARITMHAVSSSLEHELTSGVTLRNRISFADYDKFYRNLVPGAVNAASRTVRLTGYDSATTRQNLFNQTDVVTSLRTGRVGHALVVGIEVARQETDNRRQTAFFHSLDPTRTGVDVPLSAPTTSLPVSFRATGSDATNAGVAHGLAFYAQDQLTLSRRLQAILGLRYDRFEVDLLDRRNATRLTSEDDLVSPRLALVYKPAEAASLYASYSRSSLPRAGEQLSSLSPSNRALEPETFRNYEVGAKWEFSPALAFTAAVYRLDHGNVVVRDPVNPAVSHLVDAERSRGLELELSGHITPDWSIQGGYAFQRAEVRRSLSASVAAGARLGQVPEHAFSIWSKYDVSPRWGLGLGVISQSDSFVATDNSVVLPGFTRVDTAVFFRVHPRLRAQVNVENLFDAHYFASAHSNNNILPGSPRAVRVGLTTHF